MCKVERLGKQGMITVKCDFAKLKGFSVPEIRKVKDGIVWMSRDELLVTVPVTDVAETIKKLETTLKGQHHLIADVSDARAVFSLSGNTAREVLAKGAPVDLSPDRFQPGDIRRTRIGQVAAAFWMVDAQTFHIVCFSSVSNYLEDWLRHSARLDAKLSYF